MAINGLGEPDVFEQKELAMPQPGPNDLLVRVHATSANPVDYQTRRGDYEDLVELSAIIGVDVSEVVEAIGDAVTDFQVGDGVFYMPELFTRPGSYAEYNLVDQNIASCKPSELSHFETASLPLVWATVWDCLVTRGQLRVGESVLIHAGAGGVGSTAIQLAKALGARVLTTCSSRNADLAQTHRLLEKGGVRGKIVIDTSK
jgi:NADPH:quinone reductase-like Zn-dependent oxidoreductase